jgi:hypothetical protein
LCGGRAGNVEDPNQAGVSVSAEIWTEDLSDAGHRLGHSAALVT